MTPIPRATIKSILASLSGLQASQVIWNGEPEPAVWPTSNGAGPFGLLRIITNRLVQYGSDDVSRVETSSPSAGTMISTQRGARSLYLTLRYDSYAPVTSQLAEDVLEQIRTRVFYEPTLATLDGIKAAIINVGDITTLPTLPSVDERVLSSAVLEISFRFSQTDDRTQSGDGVIKEVHGTGTITRENGATSTVNLDTTRTP